MATTYKLIQKNILTSDLGSITFSNIPQNYTDLMIVSSAMGISGSASQLIISFNGSSSDYTLTGIYGSGTSAVPVNRSSYGFNMVGYFALGSGVPGNTEILISNYASSNHKLISSFSVSEAGLAVTDYMSIISGRWSQNNPINSVTIAPYSGAFKSGSSFFLYGVSKMDDGSQGYFGPAMTGGNEVYTTGNGYKVHVFRNSGILNVTAPGEVEYLVVGGGGGGGFEAGGGGGAGAVKTSYKLLSAGNYSITVGAGGSGGQSSGARGSNGSNSFAIGIESSGGGGGGSFNDTTMSGLNGASGGGSTGRISNADIISGGLGVSGEGFSGGSGRHVTGSYLTSGGGGGYSSSGQNYASNKSGDGGTGISLWGSFYAGGGGGGASANTGAARGIGGSGIGGNGAGVNFTTASAGSINTGSGGGGGCHTPTNAGASGASGIVIIRYRI